jgi:hypothetical protein
MSFLATKYVIPPVPMNIGGKLAIGSPQACHPGKLAIRKFIRDLYYVIAP